MDPKSVKSFQISKIHSLLQIVLILSGESLSCSEFGPEDYKNGQRAPQILISTAPDHIKFFDGNYTVLIDGIGINVRFDCWAPYPIDVEFKGHLTNRGAKVGLIERRVKDPEDLSTYCFSINITLAAYEEITGEYGCFAVQNRTLRSSHYIYHAVDAPEALLNRNMGIRLMLDLDQSFTTLPCPTSNPKEPVFLYKEVSPGELQQIQVFGNAIRYDPKVGFVILTSLLETDKLVRYRCATKLGTRDVVDIIVSQPKIIPTPGHKILKFKEGDKLKVNCKASEDFLFENSNQEVKGQTILASKTQNRGYPYVKSYVVDQLRAGDSGLLSCVPTKADVAPFEWSYITLKKEKNETKGEKRKASERATLNSVECKLPSGKMRIALHDCANWVECNLRKCNYLDRNCGSVKCDDAKTSNCVKNGIIQCFNSNNQSAQSEIFFTGIHSQRIYTNWNSAPPNLILKIVGAGNFSNENLTTSKSVQAEFVCEGSTFVFAVGFKWYLIHADQNQLPVLIPDENVQHKWKNVEYKNVIRSVVKINVTSPISQIICKAPIWNSTEWREHAINFTLFQNNTGRMNPAASATGLPRFSFTFKSFTFIIFFTIRL